MIEKSIRFFILAGKYNFTIFTTAFLLLRLPPLILPFFQTALLNSHSIARYLLLYLFGHSLLLSKKKKGSPNNKILWILISIFLIVKSASIINAISVVPFWSIYKDFIFGLVFFYVGYQLIDNKEKFNKTLTVLIFTLLINLIVQTIIYFRTDLFINIFSKILYSKYYENFLIQFNRGRYFVDIFDTCLLLLLLFFLIKANNFFKKTLFLIAFFLSIFYSLVSGFRIHLIVAFFSLLATFIFIKQIRRAIIFIFFTIILLTGILSVYKTPNVNFLTLERLLSLDSESGTSTVSTRIDFWKKATEMGISYPLFGVGLGNYYDYYSPKPIFLLSLFNPRNKLFEVTAFHPHNIFFATFSETGFLGLFSLILLLIYFIKTDYQCIKNNKAIFLRILIINFWSLFLFSLVMPDNTIQYIILFWLFRVLIEKTQKLRVITWKKS